LSCLINARFVFIAIGASLAAVLFFLLVLYFLRFVEERAMLIRGNDIKLLNPHACRLTHFAPFAAVLGSLFALACAGTDDVDVT
jgi:hypothetical protein